jgi:glycosyltransferase involved in cell wall biosynthesis
MPELNRQVLHICSDYAKQKVYGHLVQHLRQEGMRQMVFVPVRSAEEMERQPKNDGEALCFSFHHVLRFYHRLMFDAKIRKVHSVVKQAVDMAKIQVSHAHFLYSDGAVALRLKTEYGIPYVVAVRNTDLNGFMRYRPDLRPVGEAVLLGAAKIVFISPAYEKAMLARIRSSIREQVQSRCTVVPNGVAPYWLRSHPPVELRDPEEATAIRLLYVGDFSKNKNLGNLLDAVKLLECKRPVTLTLVGCGGDEHRALIERIQSEACENVRWLGRIDDEEVLCDCYRSHDILVMPSFTETFGVAYIEALSQGLMILCSRGQGVDGFFKPATVCEAADPHDPADICGRIEALANRRNQNRSLAIEEAGRFDWRKIAREYVQIYREAIPASLPVGMTSKLV